MNSTLINYKQDCLYPNAYKIGDSGGSCDAYGRGSNRGAFTNRGASRGGGGFGSDRGGGRFANFQCQICLNLGTRLMFAIFDLM